MEHNQSCQPVSHKASKRQQRKKERQKGKFRASSLVPRNDRQADFMDSLETSSQIFAIGEAGTGKTYIAARYAIQALKRGDVERIMIGRPTISNARHRQGFLPGSLEKKLAPWLIPVMDAFKHEVSASELETFMKSGYIEFLSFEHMRGRTFSNTYIILDEAQNCSVSDLRLFLTRLGENMTCVVTGDPVQVDIPDSGLETVLDLIEKHDLNADIIEFMPEDVVRSPEATEWVKAFSLWSADT